jgi:hypothetical protein
MANTLFAIQVFLPLEPNEALRRQLRKLILDAPDAQTPGEKRRAYEQITRALLGASGQFTVGNWDYTDDGDEADTEFEHWCAGTESDAKEREAAGDKGGGARSMFVTLAFLMESDEAAAQDFGEACDLQDHDLWKRSTFVKLLSVIPRLDFSTVVGDAVYLCPGDKEYGLTEEELSDESYEYLHKIE